MMMLAQDAQTRDAVNQQVQQSVRDAVRAAQDAAQAARAAGQPGAYAIRDDFPRIPSQVPDIANGFFTMCAVIVIGWPLARAFGKRIERKAAAPPAPSPQLNEQLARIEQAVDAMSIEIERISESQRFIARIQSQSSERSNAER